MQPERPRERDRRAHSSEELPARHGVAGPPPPEPGRGSPPGASGDRRAVARRGGGSAWALSMARAALHERIAPRARLGARVRAPPVADPAASPFLVTASRGRRNSGLAMAVEAPPHRERLGGVDLTHLIDAPVAGHAPDAVAHMRRMIEEHEVGETVHAASGSARPRRSFGAPRRARRSWSTPARGSSCRPTSAGSPRTASRRRHHGSTRR